MWSPENIDFSNHEASTFLIASWHELFHAFTPDANQPRLHNVGSLVDELADISNRCCQESRSLNHVKKIQDELNQAIEDEESILCKLPEYRTRVQYITRLTAPKNILVACHLLGEQREQYEQALIETVIETVNKLPQKKSLAHKNIRRLATVAFQHSKEDNDVWDQLNKDASREPGEILAELVALSKNETKQYQCILGIIGSQADIQSTLRMVGFSLISRSKLLDSYLNEFHEPPDRLTFVKYDVEAVSIRSAVTSCRKQLGIATGLLSLYQNSQSLQVHPTALVRVDGSDIHFLQTEQAFRRLHPRARAREDVKEGLELLKAHPIDGRLLGAIELLSLASSSSDSRVRLINLWSSIETLAGGHEGDTTLEKVSAMLVPLIISRQVGRATRNLAIETQNVGAAMGEFHYGVGFPRSTPKFVSPREMLKTLTSPKDSQPITELLDFAAHPLLRYRINRAWATIHDPKQVRSMLTRSKTRLEWHIARIYRSRNLLVHEGEESPFLVPILDNLQNYLSMTVQRLIHEFKAHPTWEVRHTIEHWNGKMEHLLTSLKRSPEVLTVDDFIDGESNEHLWP